jgi:hypothetical protein
MSENYVEKQIIEQGHKENDELIELNRSISFTTKRGKKRLANVEINIYIPQSDEEEVDEEEKEKDVDTNDEKRKRGSVGLRGKSESHGKFFRRSNNNKKDSEINSTNQLTINKSNKNKTIDISFQTDSSKQKIISNKESESDIDEDEEEEEEVFQI